MTIWQKIARSHLAQAEKLSVLIPGHLEKRIEILENTVSTLLLELHKRETIIGDLLQKQEARQQEEEPLLSAVK